MSAIKGFLPLVVVGTFLMLGSISTSKSIAPSWNFEIENITALAMSRSGNYLIAACERSPLCEKGQFYVFDRYGNTVTHGCIGVEIAVVDVANNSTFFVGTRNGYYFSPASGRVQEEIGFGSIFRSVSISEKGEIVIAGTDKEIFIFDKNGIVDTKEIGRSVNSTAIDSLGRIAIAATQDKVFLYKRMANEWIEKTIPTGTIADLAISDDGSTIICGMFTHIVWILDSRLNLVKPTTVEGTVTSVATNTNGRLFLCGTRKGKVFCLNSLGDELWSSDVEKTVSDVFISSDGGLAAALSDSITFFDSTGKKIQKLETSHGIKEMQLSKSGEILSHITDDELTLTELYQRSHVPTCEYLFPSRRSIPLDDQLIEMWSYGKNPQFAIPADINGDRKNEIVCTFGKEVVVLNSKGKVMWKRSFSFQPGIAVFDLTGDFVPEVIVKSRDNRMGFYVFDERGQERAYHEFYSRWYAEPPPEEMTIGIHPIMSSDIDDDGLIEVVCIVSAGYLLNPRGLFVFEYPSFQEEWYYAVAPDLSTIHVVDINGDGQVEIVAGSYAPCNGREVKDTDDCHAYVYAVTSEGKTLWRTQVGPRGFIKIDTAVADLDGDGNQEIVGGGWSYGDDWGTLFVLGHEGNYIFGEEREFSYSVFLEGVADLDDDGDLEILTSSSPSMLALYDHRLRVIKRKDVEMKLGPFGGVAINDIDADGEKEIILTSDDKKLMILNAELDEEASETFSGFGESVKTVVVHLYGCKNHLLVLADKLRTYTYSKNPDGPCMPWIIAEEQKTAEAEEFLRNGDHCLEKEDCECAKAEFTSARTVYEQIEDQDGIAVIEEKLKTAETCLNAQDYLRKAVETLESESLFMVQEYLSQAEEAYENIGNQEKLREIHKYFQLVRDIEEASDLFDIGRSQIEAELTQKGLNNLERARDIYRSCGWLYHAQLVENQISEVTKPVIDYGWLEILLSTGNIIIGIVGIIIGITSNIVEILPIKRRTLVYKEIPKILLSREDAQSFSHRKDTGSVHQLRFKFINNGNEQISEQDFIEHITFEFNSQAKIWDASANDRDPKSMQLDFDYQKGVNVVGVTVNFIGPGEWFILDFYVEDYEKYDITTRMRKVKGPRKYTPLKSLYNLSIVLFLFGMVTLIPIAIAETLRFTEVFPSKMPLYLIIITLVILEFTFIKRDWFDLKYDP